MLALRSRLRQIALATALVVGLLSGASASAETLVFSPTVKLTFVYPYNSGVYFAITGSTVDSNSTCPNYFEIRDTEPNFYPKLSGLLTALSTNASVRVVFDDDFTGCWTPVDRFQIDPPSP